MSSSSTIAAMPIKRVWFPNLNGVRAIAAFMVFFSHIEQFKLLLKHPAASYIYISGDPDLGTAGVLLFFVLSGFLITYLLLQEKADAQQIAVKKFYIRRILKIWPVYYLIILFSFFLLPHIPWMHIPNWTAALGQSFWLKAFLFLFFAPHFSIALFPPVPFASQAWSIGVEEQFYLIWPVLIKWTKSISLLLLGLIGGYHLVFFGLHHLAMVSAPGPVTRFFYSLWMVSCWDCMALGGAAAYLLFSGKQRILNIFFHPITQCVVYGLIITLLVTKLRIPFVSRPFFVALFTIAVLNLAGNPRSLLNLNYRPLDYLGRISYGLYMYHAVAIVIVLKVSLIFGVKNNLALYSACTVTLLALASLSFRFFERPILKAKVHYSTVISGDNAHGTL